MSVANPQNDWEQGMLDAVHEVLIDPIVKQVARELGYRGYICSQTEQENPHEQTQTREQRDRE